MSLPVHGGEFEVYAMTFASQADAMLAKRGEGSSPSSPDPMDE
jgi:hypothetical protein